MQVIDDPELLQLMLLDAADAPDAYKPTNFWSVLDKRLLPELQRSGLKDFRRRKNSILSTFGATDLAPPQGDASTYLVEGYSVTGLAVESHFGSSSFGYKTVYSPPSCRLSCPTALPPMI
jgi:hypothetical protein